MYFLADTDTEGILYDLARTVVYRGQYSTVLYCTSGRVLARSFVLLESSSKLVIPS
jgi:hypothetical protein